MSWADELRDVKAIIQWKASSIVAFHFRNWRGTVAFFVLALCLWVLWVTVANAEPTRQCVEREWRSVCAQDWPHDRCRRRHVCVRYGYVESWRRDYASPRRDWDDQQRCYHVRRVVGDQHLTVDGAKKAANDAWAGAVRFHHGESAMDLANARDISYVCSRSSIKEGGVTTLGQILTRCEIEAIPCRPLRSREEKEDQR